MNTRQADLESLSRGLLGRVFTADDTLHCVVGIDPDSGLVELNRHKNKQTTTVQMTLAEVFLKLS